MTPRLLSRIACFFKGHQWKRSQFAWLGQPADECSVLCVRCNTWREVALADAPDTNTVGEK